eukprot:8082561-Lingulodinium_polyedra.AAC.1
MLNATPGLALKHRPYPGGMAPPRPPCRPMGPAPNPGRVPMLTAAVGAGGDARCPMLSGVRYQAHQK